MNVIRPGSTFKIVWTISDPSDSTTYYPTVTINKSSDGSLLGTFSLALESAGRYSYGWQVPQDVTGLGTQIDMTILVYTDAGHTTLSSVYTRENRVYEILDLFSLMRSGGSSGSGVDYDAIRKIIRKEITNIIFPDYTKSFGSIDGSVGSLATAQAELKLIVNQLSQVLFSRFDGVDAKLDLDSKFEGVGGSVKSLTQNLEKISDRIEESFGRHQELFLQSVQGLAFTLGRIEDHLNESIKNTTDQDADTVRLQDVLSDINELSRVVRIMHGALMNIESVNVHSKIPMPDLSADPKEPKKPDYLPLARRLVQ